MASPYRHLDPAIDEARLISLAVDPASRRAAVRLDMGGRAGPDGPRGEWMLVLHGVSRVAAWLRGVHYPSGPGQGWAPGQELGPARDIYPPVPLHGPRDLNDWLRRWSGQELYGQAEEIFDARAVPAWLDEPSLDLAWPGRPHELHTLDLWLGDNARVGAHMLDLRIEFAQLEVLGGARAPGPGSPAAGPPSAAPADGAGGWGDRVAPGSQGARGAGPAGSRARDGAGSSRPPGGGAGGGRHNPGRAGAPYPRGAGAPRSAGGSRRPSARVRRRRATAALAGLVVVVLGVAAWAGVNGGGGGRGPRVVAGRTPGRSAAPAVPALAAAESGLLPWSLAAPISREVVVAGPRGRLIILGGLTAGGASANGIFSVRTATGAASAVGSLRAPTHDAAAAVLGGRDLVFGGGSAASVASVEGFAPRGGGPAAAVGSLPAPRSDLVSVTIGGTAYLLGGYTGSAPDASVLATTSGRSFSTVATLPVPVRYPAAAALGGEIYVFGGQAVTGRSAGKPLDVIQAVDPARHTARVIGRLPEPLAGAAAVTVAGELFVAGGESTVRQHRTPGLGTTQLGPGQASAASPTSTSTVSTIWAFDPTTGRMLPAGQLQVPVSHAGVAVAGSTAWLVGGESHGALVAAVQMLRPNRAFGTAGAPGAGSPYFGGKLLIADRGNDRLLLLNDRMQIVWKYPSATTPRDRLGFYFPDDAFFVDHGTAILSNQEQNETIVKIAYPSGKIIWSYGHPHHHGTAPGYLYEPDDAYLLRNGQITVADANNCRVLVINPNGTVAHQIGTTGVCVHHPPTSLGMPNGDTPLADGNLLISEIIGSYVSEYTMTGKLVWTTHLPISYPSDPQQLGADRYLIADYSAPGAILQFNRQGRILYRYQPPSGPGMLNHPSLSERLPSGVFMVNDDYNDRMAAIDPVTGALVWQYGVTGRPGTAPGRLRTPDGFDLLLPNGTTPTHPVTG